MSPSRSSAFLQHLESNCIFGCCGSDAFDFRFEHSADWVCSVGDDVAWQALNQARTLRTALREPGSGGEAMAYPINEWPADFAVHVLDHAVAHLARVLLSNAAQQLETAPAPSQPVPAQPYPWPIKMLAIILTVPVVCVAFIVCFPFLVYAITRKLIQSFKDGRSLL